MLRKVWGWSLHKIALEKDPRAPKVKSIVEYNKEQEERKKAEEEKKRVAADAPKKAVVC